MMLPPRMSVPATPAISDIDIRTLYDLDNAKLLGKGGFSEVVAAMHYPTGEYRALKLMQRSTLRGKKAEMVTHEKEILRRTCHPNIITLYETIQNSDIVCLSLDLMDEDLFELIVRHKRINEPLTRKIMHQVLSGIAYLHEQSVIHRDIKPENILVNLRYKKINQIINESCNFHTYGSHNTNGDGDSATHDPAHAICNNDNNSNIINNINNNKADINSTGDNVNSCSTDSISDASTAPTSDRFYGNVNEVSCDDIDVSVKLADFGLAKLVLEWDVQSTPCGTSFYIAPEVIRGIEMQGAKPLCTNKRLVKSVDVWSAGIVFFLLLSGRPPFHGQVKTPEERRALLTRINHGVLFSDDHGWSNVSLEAKDLIFRMLEQDTCRRVTALEALKHPFFTAHGFDRPIPGGDMLARMKAEAQRVREHQQELQAKAEKAARRAAERKTYEQDKQIEHNHMENSLPSSQEETNQGKNMKTDTSNKTTNSNVEYHSSGAASVPLPGTEINKTSSPVSSNDGRNAEQIHDQSSSRSDKQANKDAPQHKKNSILSSLTNFLSGRSSNNSNSNNAMTTQSNRSHNSQQEQNDEQQQQQQHHHHHHHHRHPQSSSPNNTNKRISSPAQQDITKIMSAISLQPAISAEGKEELHAELAKLQQDMIMADDVEGDETSYKSNMPYIEAKPSRPAMMNTKIKVGPQALKRKDK